MPARQAQEGLSGAKSVGQPRYTERPGVSHRGIAADPASSGRPNKRIAAASRARVGLAISAIPGFRDRPKAIGEPISGQLMRPCPPCRRAPVCGGRVARRGDHGIARRPCHAAHGNPGRTRTCFAEALPREISNHRNGWSTGTGCRLGWHPRTVARPARGRACARRPPGPLSAPGPGLDRDDGERRAGDQADRDGGVLGDGHDGPQSRGAASSGRGRASRSSRACGPPGSRRARGRASSGSRPPASSASPGVGARGAGQTSRIRPASAGQLDGAPDLPAYSSLRGRSDASGTHGA